MRIERNDAIAIVVDYQEKLMPVILDNETVVKNSEILINGLRELEVPFIVSQQYTKGLGETVAPIANALNDVKYFEKKSFSLWQSEEIKEAIIASGKKTAIICGVEAHICVLQTVIDLRDAGYNVVLVADCIGSRKKIDKRFALKRAVEEGAFLTTHEAILYELTIGADSPHFKIISKLTK